MCGPLRSAIRFIFIATVASGCHFFDPKLYQQTPDGAVPRKDGGPGVGGNADASLAGNVDASLLVDAGRAFDLGTTGPLCGRATPSSLCPSSYLFCDGFEDENAQMFSRWSSWLADNLSGSPANLGTNLLVDGTTTCLGQHALHATTVGKNQEAIVIRTFSNWPNPLHVRIFMNIKQHVTSAGLIEFRSSAGDFASLFLDPPTTSLTTSRFGLQTSFVTATPTIGPELSLAHNQWLCVELTMRFETASGEAHLALDGNPVGDIVGVQTEPQSSVMDRMALGPISDDTAGLLSTNEIYFDEVAVAAGPIGCM